VYYGNGVIAKDLTQAAWKKSRSDRIVVGAPVTQPDFTLSATSPNSVSSVSGGTTVSTVTVTPQNGFADPVTLSANGLPTGVTAGFSPNPTTAASTLTLTVNAGVAAGTYPITVTGSSATLTRTTTLSLTVSAGVRLGSAFTPGNLVVYRLGDGTSALSGAATAAFLDEYTTGGTLVQSLPLPTTVSGSNQPLTNSGSATSEGALARSADGRYLTFAGYGAAPGTASIASSTSATTARIIGRVEASGVGDTSTRITDAFSGNNVRAAVTNDGSSFWVVGATSGVRYVTLGSTGSSSDISTTPANLRTVNIFGGQLYVTSGSGTLRYGSVGAGLPTTGGQAIAGLPGFSASSGSPYSFFFADLSASVAGLDTLYIADDTPGTLQKYSLVSGSWTANGTVSTANLRGLTASVSGTTVTLYGSTPTAIFKLTDSSGYNATSNGGFSSLASAGTNTAFRGIAFAPQP
jgi:hypothetical protein